VISGSVDLGAGTSSDAIEYTFLSAPLSKEQLAEAIQIPPRK